MGVLTFIGYMMKYLGAVCNVYSLSIHRVKKVYIHTNTHEHVHTHVYINIHKEIKANVTTY